MCSCQAYSQRLWLRRHRKWLDKGVRSSNVGPKCQGPPTITNRYLLSVRDSELCPLPSVSSLQLSNIQPSSFLVTWESPDTNMTGLRGFIVAYHRLDRNDQVKKYRLDPAIRGFKVGEVADNTLYLVCVVTRGSSFKRQDPLERDQVASDSHSRNYADDIDYDIGDFEDSLPDVVLDHEDEEVLNDESDNYVKKDKFERIYDQNHEKELSGVSGVSWKKSRERREILTKSGSFLNWASSQGGDSHTISGADVKGNNAGQILLSSSQRHETNAEHKDESPALSGLDDSNTGANISSDATIVLVDNQPIIYPSTNDTSLLVLKPAVVNLGSQSSKCTEIRTPADPAKLSLIDNKRMSVIIGCVSGLVVFICIIINIVSRPKFKDEDVAADNSVNADSSLSSSYHNPKMGGRSLAHSDSLMLPPPRRSRTSSQSSSLANHQRSAFMPDTEFRAIGGGRGMIGGALVEKRFSLKDQIGFQQQPPPEEIGSGIKAHQHHHLLIQPSSQVINKQSSTESGHSTSNRMSGRSSSDNNAPPPKLSSFMASNSHQKDRLPVASTGNTNNSTGGHSSCQGTPKARSRPPHGSTSNVIKPGTDNMTRKDESIGITGLERQFGKLGTQQGSNNSVDTATIKKNVLGHSYPSQQLPAGDNRFTLIPLIELNSGNGGGTPNHSGNSSNNATSKFGTSGKSKSVQMSREGLLDTSVRNQTQNTNLNSDNDPEMTYIRYNSFANY